MEKISDKLKDFKDIPTTKELESYKSNCIDELYSSAYIRNFLETNKLDSSFVSKHLVELLDMAKSAKPCEKCPGYLKCPNVPKGLVQIFNLKNNSVEYAICKKLKEINPIKNSYVIMDFPEEWLYNNLEKLFTNVYVKSIIPTISNLIMNNSNKGLYLYGPSGCGKSFIAATISNEYIKTTAKKVIFANFRNLLESIKLGFDDDSYSSSLNELKEIDMLVLDDLGTEKVSEWSTFQILFDILQYRLRNKKLTVITSLYSIDELTRLYGGNNPKTSRLIEMIKMLCDIKAIEGINYNSL